MNWLATAQTTVTGDLGKHGKVTLFPCLNCDNLVLKKCLSLCLELCCHNDWWLQNRWLQHLECFVMFSFKCLWTEGQKKVFYHVTHSSLTSVVRWSQALPEMKIHSAEEDRADQRSNPTCQGASKLFYDSLFQAIKSMRPLPMGLSPKCLEWCHFCVDICDCIRIKWCS